MAQLALLGGPKTVTAAVPLWPQLSDQDLAAIRAALDASKTSIWYLNSMPGMHAPALRGDQTVLVGQIADAVHKVIENRGALLDHVRAEAR